MVRLLDAMLERLDFSGWEAKYCPHVGRPGIHPRVLAGVLLYGLLKRIRSSRALEEALLVRLDFRWLAEGRTIDHTTLSEFRREHPEELKNLFVQIGLIARQMGHLPLEQLAFDGTRIRANNRRRGTRRPAELRQLQEELAARYAELEAQMAAADARDNETFGTDSPHVLSEQLADLERRRAQVAAAVAELERIQQAGQAEPKRLPLTDPQSRVMPNKEGGFAPNYTPTATVDVNSGLIVSADVINQINEDGHLAAAIEDVQESFGLDAPPPEMLADGLMGTGQNLAELEALGVTLYSPVAQPAADNPALREDLRVPVPEPQWDQLPTKTVTRNGQKAQQLDKSAFVYVEEEDCYYCPQGQALSHQGTLREEHGRRQRVRQRYTARAAVCAACPLRDRCLAGNAQKRQITHEEHEQLRNQHAQRMATPEAQEKYARRRHPGERPFAMIKHHFGARRFLLRGLERVKCEWHWMASAFNLHRLMNLIHSGADPPPVRVSYVD
jgi:transposase